MPPDSPDPLDLLVAGDLDAAIHAFRTADPRPETAAGLAIALAASGETDLDDAVHAVRTTARDGTREDRHRAEVIVLLLHGRADRATGLAREHLVDHPDDRLVRLVLDRWA